MINKKIVVSLIFSILFFSVSSHLYIKNGYGIDKNGYNVVLIVIETLRADHLSCYGYNRNTSENLDKLAKEGALFKRCFAQAPWTLSSLASIFTSLYPSSHNVNAPDSYLSPEAKTLAEILKENGFLTQGFISGNFARGKYGLSQGFDNYNEDNVLGRNRVSSYQLTDDAIEWLRSNSKDRFFLFLHYYEPHYNYMYHREFSFYKEKSKNIYSNIPIEEIREKADLLDDEDMETLIGYYDGEIKLVDHCLGKLFDEMHKLGIYDKTIIVVTSDHGEEFGVHGYFGHTYTIYNDVLHVPLIMRTPNADITNRIVNEVVSSIDIMPTILNLVEIKSDYDFQGTDLSEYFRKEEHAIDREISIAETWNKWFRKSLQTKEWKLTVNDIDGVTYYELFNLFHDPQETKNLTELHKEKFIEYKQRLSSQMKIIQKRIFEEGKVEQTNKELDKLRSLGYVQ